MKSLLIIGTMLLATNAMASAKRVVSSTYTCPSTSSVKYTIDFKNDGRGGDGYNYSASMRKIEGNVPSFVSAYATGSEGARFTINCIYHTQGGDINYSMHTSQYRLNSAASACKVNGLNVTCDTY